VSGNINASTKLSESVIPATHIRFKTGTYTGNGAYKCCPINCHHINRLIIGVKLWII